MVLGDDIAKRCSQVHGQILHEEGLLLADFASKVPSGQLIVEVGAFKGKSTCYLAAGAKAGGGALVYSIDLWERSPWPEYSDPEVRKAWDENIGHLGLIGQAIAVPTDTAEAASQIIGDIGLLFIDSDHSYEGVCRDIEVWAGKVALDGVMVFHDAASSQWGVAKAIREKLLAEGRYTWELRFGLAIVRRAL